MPLDDRDAAYLWDMLQAAKEVHGMMGEHELESFLHDRVLQRALERCIEIIGEAARRVSEQARAETPKIQWREIIGQRNILAHEYGQIDHKILYKTATQDIPRLIAALVVLLPPLD